MSSAKKATVLILAGLVTILILMQLVMGQLILSGRTNLIKAHQHTGYTAVFLTIVYVALSAPAILRISSNKS